MSRLHWALARVPLSLLAVGVGRLDSFLPKPPAERSRPEARWAPAHLGLGMLGWAARRGARTFHDHDGPWREFGNKVEAVGHFRSAGAAPGAGAAVRPEEDPFADLWRREGKGYLSGLAASRGREDAASARESGLSRHDLITHHTGLGLGLAVGHLARVGRRSSVAAAEVRAGVGRFIEGCRRLSYPGYEEMSIEALGLTVELRCPGLRGVVEEAVRDLEPSYCSLFWHGVGRGIYFNPADLAPRRDARWGALGKALAAPDAREARLNAVAGVAWALALVNIRHPATVAWRLGSEMTPDTQDAAANGVASATVLWRDTVGDETVLRRFVGYRREAAVAGINGYSRLVADAVDLAQREIYPLLHREMRLGEIFRYRPVSRWVETLGGSPTGWERGVS